MTYTATIRQFLTKGTLVSRLRNVGDFLHVFPFSLSFAHRTERGKGVKR